MYVDVECRHCSVRDFAGGCCCGRRRPPPRGRQGGGAGASSVLRLAQTELAPNTACLAGGSSGQSRRLEKQRRCFRDEIEGSKSESEAQKINEHSLTDFFAPPSARTESEIDQPGRSDGQRDT